MKFLIEINDEIKNFNESVTVTKKNGDVVEGIYKMVLSELVEIMNDSAVRPMDDMLETSILPKNCIKFVWRNIKKKEADIYIEVPKAQRDVIFHKTKINHVGFPRLIFKYAIHNQHVKLAAIVALKSTDAIRHNTPIYMFPFSHVATDGSVCMGGNTFPKIERIQQVESFHNLFLNSPFNSDYGGKTTVKKSVNILFDELANKDFPDEWLLPFNKKVMNDETKKYESKPITINDFFQFTTN